MSIWSNVSFKADISLLIFCLDDLPRAVIGVFSPYCDYVFFQFLPLVLLVVALHISVLPDWVHIDWEVLCLLNMVPLLSL